MAGQCVGVVLVVDEATHVVEVEVLEDVVVYSVVEVAHQEVLEEVLEEVEHEVEVEVEEIM